MKNTKCYIYTRVSTSMQVDGYSLDAQKEKLKKYAEFQDMMIAGEYSDEGKSGKNIDGRLQFVQMLKDIEAGKDNVDFVLVFKLSHFGRNAADVLSSLQRMQDFGVNLIYVEDGIDSSKDSGKLMISVLSAMAEIDRENILYILVHLPQKEVFMDQICIRIQMEQTGKHIRKLLMDNGYSVRDIQHAMGFSSPQAVYKWLSGQSLPSVDNLVVLSKILHTSIDNLLVVDGDF